MDFPKHVIIMYPTGEIDYVTITKDDIREYIEDGNKTESPYSNDEMDLLLEEKGDELIGGFMEESLSNFSTWKLIESTENNITQLQKVVEAMKNETYNY